MAFAFVSEFDSGDDRSTANYDALAQRIDAQGTPDGLIIHAAGFDDSGVFRVFEVWESSDHQARFWKEHMEPLLEEGPVDPSKADPPDRMYRYELHHVVTG